MPTNILADLLAKGAALFDDRTRLLKLRFPDDAPVPAGSLLPQTLTGEEALSQSYRYQLDCLSADAFVELKDLFGLPAEIALLLPDGSERLLTGLVTGAAALDADGGFARYRLTLEPALAALAHRYNSRVFQDRSVPAIVAALLDEHLAANPALARSFQYQDRLGQTYPARSYCLQYRESDLAFIERLLAEEGISYRYTHGPDPDTSLRAAGAGDDDPGVPLHTLLLIDAGTAHPSGPADPVRFHRTDGVEREDAIDAWEGRRTLQSGQSALVTYDYQHPGPYGDAQGTWSDSGPSGNPLSQGLEDYDPQALYYGADRREMARYATLRQQAKDLATKTFQGESSARHLETGTWFELKDHPVHDQDAPEDREFLVTGLSFEASNNLLPAAPPAPGSRLAAGTGTAAGTGQNAPPYRNAFTAVRRQVPLVPPYTGSRHQKPTAPGSTTATVVGPEGEEIFTDDLGRIKLQFHWQRPQDHPAGGAGRDERSSTWVRVAMPSAGADWGSQAIPRIGQEVVVSFLEGDIDRPLVTGVVYNGTHRPPRFSGAGQLPANKTLSGHKSKEYRGHRYNELLFDDSTHEIRVKLSSEHGKTQLNQGYLIHPRSDGQGEPRGEGFELRTDHHGALRAAQGLLISTESQPQAAGKQLAREQAQGQLEAAFSLAKDLGAVATKQAADTLETGPEKVDADNKRGETVRSGHIRHHVDALSAWEAGSNTDRDGKTAKDEAGRQPLIVLAAPAGVASLSGQNQTLAAGTNLDLVAQRDTNQTSGRRWLHNVGEHVSLFVNGVKDRITLKLIAAKGKVQVQAQAGEIEATADQDVTITSCKGKVTIAAKNELLFASGGGYIRIAGGNIDLHCPDTLSEKGAQHLLSGSESMSVALPVFPSSELKAAPLKLGLKIADIPGSHGVVPVGQPWKIIRTNGALPRSELGGTAHPAIFDPQCWDKVLCEGTLGDDGKLVLTEAQQQGLYQETAGSPGNIWVVSGLTAMPTASIHWSTETGQANPTRILDSLNFAADGQAINSVTENYLAELARSDADVAALNARKREVDL